MQSTCLVTPSYPKDFNRCELLCESIDRYVTGYIRHYVIVDDADMPQFEPLTSARRVVLPVSHFLPVWMNSSLSLNAISSGQTKLQRALLPVWLNFSLRLNAWDRRLKLPTLWLLGKFPISGWHIQQLVKLSAAARVAEPVTVLVDSDIVFLHPWNVASWLGERLPLYRAPGGISAENRQHVGWLATACTILGLAPLKLPATDYICPLVAWNQPVVRNLLDRISQNMGQPWVLALCREQAFSEYLLYGCHVASDPADESRHRWLDYSGPCHTYWWGTKMTESDLREFIAGMAPAQVAICLQSHGQTPVDVIRMATGFAR